MSFAGPTFVLAIIAMSMIAWVITTSIRARHGYPLTDDVNGYRQEGFAPFDRNVHHGQRLGTLGGVELLDL